MMCDIYNLVTVAGLAFLLGSRITAWMYARHLEAMKKIWRPDLCGPPLEPHAGGVP